MRTQHRRGRGDLGFTLLEVMISVGIFALTVEMMAGTFLAQEKAFKLQERVASTQQNLRIAMSGMAQDLRNAGGGVAGGQCTARGVAPRGGIVVPATFVGLPPGATQYTRGVFALNNQPVDPALVSPPDLTPAIPNANPGVTDTLTTLSANFKFANFEASESSIVLAKDNHGPTGGAYDFQFCDNPAYSNLFNVGNLIVVSTLVDAGLFKVAQKNTIPGDADCRGTQMISLRAATADPYNAANSHRQLLFDGSSDIWFFKQKARISVPSASLYRMVNPVDDTVSCIWNVAHPRPILMRDGFRPDTLNPNNFAPADPFADNIATLQVGLGVDRAIGNQRLTHVVGPNMGGNFEETTYIMTGGAPTVDPSRIRTVRLHVLAKSSEPQYFRSGYAGQPDAPVDSTEHMAIASTAVVAPPYNFGDWVLSVVPSGYTYRASEVNVDLKNTYGMNQDQEKLLMRACQ